MKLKLSLVFGMMVAMAFPVASIYIAWSGGEGKSPESPELALETAIYYVINNHDELGQLEAPKSWKRENITPEGLDGATILSFRGGNWIVTVDFAPIRPTNYEVQIEYAGKVGFRWAGRVEKERKVVETAFELTS